MGQRAGGTSQLWRVQPHGKPQSSSQQAAGLVSFSPNLNEREHKMDYYLRILEKPKEHGSKNTL